MNRQRTWSLLAVLGLTGALVAALIVVAEPAEDQAAQVQWGACPDGVEDPAAGPAQLQCATVTAPLNYREPADAQIEIMISRLASKNPDKRRGVLLLNPGGPGGAGLDQPEFLAAHGLPAEVLDSYDVIGIDTRGVGHSAPVSCGFTDDQVYFGNIPPYAVNDAAVTERAKVARGVAEQCAANDHEGRLRYVSTANMARDLDRIREALGADKASFLGYSYGTALGAAYASMFPQRADRIVLDSNIGDTYLDHDGMRLYGRGMEETFPDFAAWAAARHDTYGLGRTPDEVRRTYFTLAERLDANPVDGMDGNLFRFGTFFTLYRPALYASAAESWKSLLETGRPGPASGRPPGTGAASPNDNAWSVFLAVTCNDIEWPEDVQAYHRAVAEDRERYPLYGAATANVMPCAYWKLGPSEPPVRIDDSGPADVLIVQNQRDPVTPLRGGELLDEKFGRRSRLVTVDGSGHGVYVLGANRCASDVVTSYLVDGIMPEHDTTCPAG
ncbi:putative tripeptidylaminopeptidase [Nocardia brasiliensis NBRC 14402]|uniref:alpha/beta hydrolase n=1 Tax=Nocardia brasiliensis TaxID=37326 RepID=UPI000313035D|nr:alpha/beta hydrolase [Nocardia brasiliensis]AVL26467.1 alpha/beta hydrolase [Nocardia brasiliensis]GAJ85486.1 putative tripeptidylaminopeptidase [Nocardia brasiliensis NBRC 14402]SUB10729.1 Tripeptidyl aminopeptidase precursor [Nocardia brasiliensis]